MSDDDEHTELPGWLGSRATLPDAEFWRARATAADGDLAAICAAVLQLRARFGALELTRALAALVNLAEGSHAVARLVQADQEAVRLLEAAGAPVSDEVMVVFPREGGTLRAVPPPTAAGCSAARRRAASSPPR